jgi:uncharacterized membrane protein
LGLCAILTALPFAAAAVLPDGHPVRVGLALPILVFVPGYLLVTAAWPREADLELTLRIAMAMGTSVGLWLLVALALVYGGSTFTTGIVSLSGGAVSGVLLLAAIARRIRAAPEERFRPFGRAGTVATERDPTTTLAAVTLVVAALILAYIALNQPGEAYTALAILDENGGPDIPLVISVNDTLNLTLSIQSQQREPRTYEIVATVLNETGVPVDGSAFQEQVTLSAGEDWTAKVEFGFPSAGRFRVQVELFEESDAEPVATGHTWVEVTL